jgi:formate-dependent phosphoribosylglycinamide formyltransferase (GAR transformylase)
MRRLKVMMLPCIYISKTSTEYYIYCRNITSEVNAVAAIYVDFAAMNVARFMYVNTMLHR